MQADIDRYSNTVALESPLSAYGYFGSFLFSEFPFHQVFTRTDIN